MLDSKISTEFKSNGRSQVPNHTRKTNPYMDKR